MKKLLCAVLAAVMLIGAVTAVSADGSPFSDVKTSRWSYKYITYATEHGLMDGVGGGKFDPAGQMTRGMVVTVLWRMEEKPPVEFEAAFSDVKAGKYYSSAVIWAKNNEIVNGVSEGKFDPGGKITREQLCTMLYRYAEFKDYDTRAVNGLSTFPDGDKAHSYAKNALIWATEKGLITGVKSGDMDLLDPRGNATREQFAAILMRFCEADLSWPVAYESPVPISTYTEPEYPLVTDADVYVATDGDDSGPGTLEAPVRTFERARDLVREKKATATDEIVVAFKAGEYGSLDSLTLGTEDGGTAEVPVRYCKYGDGDVVFNNGVTLRKEEFEPLSEDEKAMFPESSRSGVMKLDLDPYFPDGLPDGIGIFGDEGLIWEARYPNKYGEGIDSYVKNSMVLPEDVPNYYGMTVTILPPLGNRVLGKVNHFKDMKMTGYIMWGFRVDSFYVKDFDKETRVLTIDDTRLPDGYEGVGIRTPQMELDEIYFENSPDFLDGEGEYWYDRDTNTIYVYDPCDEYNVGLGGTFLTLDGANYVSLVGLTFRNSRDADAVIVKDSAHVTLDRCNISGVYLPVEAVGDSDHLTVTGCEFSRFIRNGVLLRQTKHRTTLESNHVKIDNCYFHDYGLSKIFANQAVQDETIGAVISHNLFENSPNGAILLGTLSTVEYNVFDNMMTSTQDYGIIYTWNAISDHRHNTVRYNLFSNMNPTTGATYGLYMDDYTQDQYIYGNLFYRCGECGVMLHQARDQFVYDNAFIYSNFNTNGFGYIDDDGKVWDNVLPDGTGWRGQYNRYYVQRVNEGEEGYEIWKATFPSLYAFEPDVENPLVYTSYFCPWDSIHNNALIGSKFNIMRIAVEYGDVHDNMILTEDENPFFVNPAKGDYRLRDGVDFFYIPFEEMGRY